MTSGNYRQRAKCLSRKIHPQISQIFFLCNLWMALLGFEQEFTSGFPTFEIAMRLLCFGERVDFVNPQLELAPRDRPQYIARTPFELLARQSVVRERRARDEERSFLREL